MPFLMYQPKKIKNKHNKYVIMKIMSLNYYEIRNYKKTHPKLKSLLQVLVKECKNFQKSDTIVFMRTSIPKI